MPVFSIIHWLGKRHSGFLLSPVFVYAGSYEDGLLFIIIPFIGTHVSAFLKDVFRVPRPKWIFDLEEVQNNNWATEKSFSTPSNHAATFAGVSVVIYHGKNLILSNFDIVFLQKYLSQLPT